MVASLCLPLDLQVLSCGGFSLSTSPAASYEAQVIEVGVALLHGSGGIAKLSAAVVLVAGHQGDHHPVHHIITQGHHLEEGHILV